jgi:hypothetical protein
MLFTQMISVSKPRADENYDPNLYRSPLFLNAFSLPFVPSHATVPTFFHLADASLIKVSTASVQSSDKYIH